LTSAKFLGSPAPSPTTPYPTSNFAITPASTSSGSWDSTGNANFLIAAFFLIAAGWLFVAFLYAVLVLVVIRLRRRGPMDVHDEHFGRIYLLGSPSSSYQLFIPMGWLLRRYVMALNDRSVVTNRMSRVERRAALEVLFKDTAALKEQSLRFAKRKSASNPSHADEKDAELEANENPVFVEQGNTHVANGTILDNRPVENVDLEQQSPGGESPNLDEVASNAEPVCSICLGEYGTSFVRLRRVLWFFDYFCTYAAFLKSRSYTCRHKRSDIRFPNMFTSISQSLHFGLVRTPRQYRVSLLSWRHYRRRRSVEDRDAAASTKAKSMSSRRFFSPSATDGPLYARGE
jgi:hypothetical protein